MSAEEGGERAPARGLPGATILQVVASLADDNSARAAVDTACALLRSGARAIVAGAEGPLVSELQGFGGEWVTLAPRSRNPLKARRNVRALHELVSAERVDIIHARGTNATLTASALASPSGARLVSSHAGAIASPGWGDKAYARALAQSASVIVQSGYIAEHLVARYKVPRERVVVIPRRLDTRTFDPARINPARVATIRRTWKIGRGARVFLVPGRLDPGKGQLLVVDAARMLANGGLHDVVFVLAGDDQRDPDYARLISQRAAALGVGSLIRRVGPCRDMPAAYAAADLVIVPVVAPPTFARAAAEALAMGRPVVASAIGALPEIVLAPPYVADDERIGWLCAPEDAGDLARRLALAVATDGSTHRALAARAHHFAKTMFSPGHIAAATLGVYASLLQAERGALRR